MEKKTEKKTEESGEKTDENGCRYVIASSRRPERRPLERRTLVPIGIIRMKNNFILIAKLKITTKRHL